MSIGAIPLAKEIDRVPSSTVPLDHAQELRFQRLMDDFIHLSQFASQLIGNETHVLFILKGWPCSPCRSPLAVPLGSLPRSFLDPCGSM